VCVREQEGGRGAREVRGGQMVMKNIVSWEGVRQRREKGGRERREKYSKGRTEGGMYVEVDGWIVHGKYRESRAE